MALCLYQKKFPSMLKIVFIICLVTLIVLLKTVLIKYELSKKNLKTFLKIKNNTL